VGPPQIRPQYLLENAKAGRNRERRDPLPPTRVISAQTRSAFVATENRGTPHIACGAGFLRINALTHRGPKETPDMSRGFSSCQGRRDRCCDSGLLGGMSRQLQDRRFLAGDKVSQKDDHAVGKLESVMMLSGLVEIDLPETGEPVLYASAKPHALGIYIVFESDLGTGPKADGGRWIGR
jgi:hypothetical protein